MRSFLTAFFLLLITCNLEAQRPEFFREELEFGIDTIWFSVKGEYYFRNSSSGEIKPTIVFPVARTVSSPAIDTMIVLDNSDPVHQLEVSVKDTLAVFTLVLPPRSVKKIMIYYRQRHNGKEAKYILLSTKMWGKPLEKAVYHLVAEKNIHFHSISIEPDEVSDFGNSRVYSWKRDNFMPISDFDFRFTR